MFFGVSRSPRRGRPGKRGNLLFLNTFNRLLKSVIQIWASNLVNSNEPAKPVSRDTPDYFGRIISCNADHFTQYAERIMFYISFFVLQPSPPALPQRRRHRPTLLTIPLFPFKKVLLSYRLSLHRRIHPSLLHPPWYPYPSPCRQRQNPMRSSSLPHPMRRAGSPPPAWRWINTWCNLEIRWAVSRKPTGSVRRR